MITAASIQNSAFWRNHPARSPETYPNERLTVCAYTANVSSAAAMTKIPVNASAAHITAIASSVSKVSTKRVETLLVAGTKVCAIPSPERGNSVRDNPDKVRESMKVHGITGESSVRLAHRAKYAVKYTHR